MVRKVSKSVSTQTSLSWPNGNEKPNTVPEMVKPVTSRAVSTSTQTPAAKQNKQNSEPTENKPKNNKKSAEKTKNSDNHKNVKPSGPAERPSKATRNTIQTFNRFESLEDNASCSADVMDTTPASASPPGRSHSLSPRKGRNRSWHKDKSSIRLPP